MVSLISSSVKESSDRSLRRTQQLRPAQKSGARSESRCFLLPKLHPAFANLRVEPVNALRSRPSTAAWRKNSGILRPWPPGARMQVLAIDPENSCVPASRNPIRSRKSSLPLIFRRSVIKGYATLWAVEADQQFHKDVCRTRRAYKRDGLARATRTSFAQGW